MPPSDPPTPKVSLQLPAGAVGDVLAARIEVSGSVPADAVVAVVGDAAQVVLVAEPYPADPDDPAVLHALQRGSRELSRALQEVAGGRPSRPRLEVFLHCPPAFAVELGRRLARWEARAWVDDGEGWRSADDVVEFDGGDGPIALLPPDDLGRAFALGRALALVPAPSIVVQVRHRGQVVPGLELAGPPLQGGRTPTPAETASVVAQAARRSGRPDAGRAALGPLRGTGDDTVQTALARAELAMEAGDTGLAAEELLVAAGLAPVDPAVALRVARSLRRLGRQDEAAAQASRALRLDPRLDEAREVRLDALLAAGRGAEAMVEVEAIEAASAEVARWWLRLAAAHRAAGRLVEAVTTARHARRLDGDLGAAWLVDADGCVRLGRLREGVAIAEEGLVRLPADIGLARRLSDVLLVHGDAERALGAASLGLAADPSDVALLRTAAVAACEVADPRAADLVDALLVADPLAWEDVVDGLVRIGRLDRAVALVDAATGAAGDAARARFALWRGDVVAAVHHAGNALRFEPERLDAAAILVAVDVITGRHREAIARSDGLLGPLRRGLGPRGLLGEVLAWRATARMHVGEHDVARREASAAMTASRTYSPIAHAVRVLVISAPGPRDRADAGLSAYAWRAVAAQLGPLADDGAALSRGRRGDVHAQFAAILRQLGGNRSPEPTIVRDGRLVRYVTPPHPRAHARRIQRLLRTRAVPEVLDGFAALQAAFFDEPITHTYAGETLLWLGRYAEAEAELRAALALDRETVWAWIGLGACRMLQDDVDTALAVWAEGVVAVDFEGPTLFVYRAEARRRRGELDLAVRDLDVALADKPHRLATWVLRALVDADRGVVASAVRVAALVREHLPVLWTDAAADAGSDEPVAVLEATLRLMRGNRSSSNPSWCTAADDVRFGSWRGHDPAAVFGAG